LQPARRAELEPKPSEAIASARAPAWA